MKSILISIAVLFSGMLMKGHSEQLLNIFLMNNPSIQDEVIGNRNVILAYSQVKNSDGSISTINYSDVTFYETASYIEIWHGTDTFYKYRKDGTREINGINVILLISTSENIQYIMYYETGDHAVTLEALDYPDIKTLYHFAFPIN